VFFHPSAVLAWKTGSNAAELNMSQEVAKAASFRHRQWSVEVRDSVEASRWLTSHQASPFLESGKVQQTDGKWCVVIKLKDSRTKTAVAKLFDRDLVVDIRPHKEQNVVAKYTYQHWSATVVGSSDEHIAQLRRDLAGNTDIKWAIVVVADKGHVEVRLSLKTTKSRGVVSRILQLSDSMRLEPLAENETCEKARQAIVEGVSNDAIFEVGCLPKQRRKREDRGDDDEAADAEEVPQKRPTTASTLARTETSTSALSVSLTAAAATTTSPTTSPTTASTPTATTAPTPAPTTTTTTAPTPAPTPTTTTAPTPAPTPTPTTAPTPAPTTAPTTAPTPAPTTAPTTARTLPLTPTTATARTLPLTPATTAARTLPPTPATTTTAARTLPLTPATTTARPLAATPTPTPTTTTAATPTPTTTTTTAATTAPTLAPSDDGQPSIPEPPTLNLSIRSESTECRIYQRTICVYSPITTRTGKIDWEASVRPNSKWTAANTEDYFVPYEPLQEWVEQSGVLALVRHTMTYGTRKDLENLFVEHYQIGNMAALTFIRTRRGFKNKIDTLGIADYMKACGAW